MRQSLAIIGLVILGVALSGVARAEEKDDLKKFDGAWKIVRVEREGKILPIERTNGMVVTVKDGKIAIRDGSNEDTAAIKIDSSKNPGAIDFVPLDSKATALGIYRFDGDTLKLCWAALGSARPSQFVSTLETGTRLFVLTREK
jgi:uncharacterized protein (TIGR03067 family)